MFFFPCPTCSYRMQATADRIGARTLCPKCYQAVTIPDPELVAAAIPDDTLENLAKEPPLPPTGVRSRSLRVSAPVMARTAPPADAGGVVLFQPATFPTGSDMITQLTAAITMRMKPPPEPPSADFKLSNVVWLGLTGLGLVLWGSRVIDQSGSMQTVVAIAIVLMSIGIGWVAYTAGRRHWLNGVLTLLPPVTLYRFFSHRDPNNHRAFRFLLSGLLLLALVLVTPPARAAVRSVFGMATPNRTQATMPETPSARIAALVGRADRSPLLDELKRIGTAEAVAEAAPGQRPDVVTQLRVVIAMDDRPEVTAAALKSLVAWGGDTAKPDVIAALSSPSHTVRNAALQLMLQWKDLESARAVSQLMKRRDELSHARAVLKQIGGSAAETAVIELLNSASDPLTVIGAINFLEEQGGQKAADALTAFAQSTSDLLFREIASQKAESLRKRLKSS